MPTSESLSDEIDHLTKTFSTDRLYCDALFKSASASLIAELMLSHAWANSAFPICYRDLAAAVPSHFGAMYQEKAQFWNLILCDSANRDLRLVPYLAIRGLASEASAALRRALEHIGVLTHIWESPAKVLALDDTESNEYSFAFRRERDFAKAKILKGKKSSKRFAAMKMDAVASLIYENLSKLDIHGGTSQRFFAQFPEGTESKRFTCSFFSRVDPEIEGVRKRLSILVNGHKAVCGEILALCVDHSEHSDELRAAAEVWKMFASPAGELTPELSTAVDEFLSKLSSEN